MSVFEDLIDELKSENLLEATVIDSQRAVPLVGADALRNESRSTAFAATSVVVEADKRAATEESESVAPFIGRPSNDREFFRKRAIDEVTSLQMVEHVLSGVEREHMKVSPITYDDLNVKKALHRFMQVSGDLKSPEHAEAELELRQETEAWAYALYERDRKITVANIRRFCEDSRPVLSSQALISLARFYRNSPYSEDVRSKFDYVMTRLFTRESVDETRAFLFGPDEMLGHINTLYANWSSIALYTSEDDQVEVLLTVTRFDEFTVEVESAESFDELISSDFFSRVRSYKEESAEMFYVPEVVVAATKCNLAIGNRYVELIKRGRQKHDPVKLEERYGENYNDVVSHAAGKTLNIEAILDLDETLPPQGEAPAKTAKPEPRAARNVDTAEDDGKTIDLLGVNKWLMIVCLVCVLISGGVYVWAEKFAGGSDTDAPVAAPVAVEDPEINKYLRTPRANRETFYAVAQPEFEGLSPEEKRALLSRIHQYAGTKNFAKVTLLDSKGKMIAFASPERMELVEH